MNRGKGFIVFGPIDDDVQAKYALLSSRHISSDIYALHPLNGTNQVSPLPEFLSEGHLMPSIVSISTHF